MKVQMEPTKEQKRKLEQDVWQDFLDSMSDNLATTLIVLNEEFGFGEKRIRQFLYATRRAVKKFHDYKDEKLAREQFAKKMKNFGIGFNEIYFKEDLIYTRQQKKQEARNAVSVKEAEEMKRQLEFMKTLQFKKEK